MKLRRPIAPTHATAFEAIAYLASACDGAIRLDGHGFSADHVAIGHRLAGARRWSRRDLRTARRLVTYYRRQLTHAGFDVNAVLSRRRPRRISRRRARRLTPGWYPDPTGVHGCRYWNGERWTQYVSDSSGVPLSQTPSSGTSLPTLRSVFELRRKDRGQLLLHLDAVARGEQSKVDAKNAP